MYVLRKGETVIRNPARLPGCTLVIHACTHAELRALDDAWIQADTEEGLNAWADLAKKYVVSIEGLAVDGDSGLIPIRNIDDLVTLAWAWIIQLVNIEIGIANSLEGQQVRDLRAPLSGGGTDPGGTAPPVIDVPGT